MFAVPGWAVSAKSLVSETPKNASSEVSKQSSGDVSGSKKRKRTSHNEEVSKKVKANELEKLWNGAFGAGQTSKRGNVQEKNPKLNVSTQAPSQPHRGDNSAAKDIRSRDEVYNAQSSGHEKNKHRHDKNNPEGHEEQKRVKQKRPSSNPAATTSAVPGNVQKTNPAIADKTSELSSPAIEALKPPQPAPPAQTTKLTPLQAKMRNKLTSARFRHLNQTLYTTSSEAALKLFSESPELFTEYHAGFSQQVKDSWPQNPVDEYVKAIRTRGQLDSPSSVSSNGGPSSSKVIQPLPRRKTGSCTIADLGCGDAPLARGCQSQIKVLQLKFHNYDLHAANNHITVADISNLPLRDGEADIAVFCLSLMGTNWISFVEEAWRILRGDGKGEVWVAEVKSRFGRSKSGAGAGAGGKVVENSVGKRRKPQAQKQQSNNGGDLSGDEMIFAEDAAGNANDNSSVDETDISAFVEVFQRRGFALKPDSLDKSNKMFVSMTFLKSGVPVVGKHKGLKWNGREYQRQQEGALNNKPRPDGKSKFVDAAIRKKKIAVDQSLEPEEEAKVLKPCVYKPR